MAAKRGKKVTPAKVADFAGTFTALKKILEPYAPGKMRVAHDQPGYYCIETKFPVMGRGSMMFGAVRIGKAYVSYHLLPLYMNEPLQKKVSPELNRRKQGKACFNFGQPDKKLFAELAELTRLGFESFKKLASA